MMTHHLASQTPCLPEAFRNLVARNQPGLDMVTTLKTSTRKEIQRDLPEKNHVTDIFPFVYLFGGSKKTEKRLGL